MEPIFIAILSGVVAGLAPNIALLFGTINKDKRDAYLQRAADELGVTDLSTKLNTQRKRRLKAHNNREQHPRLAIVLIVGAVLSAICSFVLFSMTVTHGAPGTTRDLDFPGFLCLLLAFVLMIAALVVAIRDTYWAAPSTSDKDDGAQEG